ncbi:hypothetical protein [Paenibacillus agricola]|uniref:Uncharacterized protein n=1 Tax=Paenibacillus agricola TaxID=2716264 RepID=A0ABX0JFU2_9BACL|nr:hypothetical protein [Paenibacillus agricola]NHN33568.1 hypothetical protein [Paenibacillus agricola]
MKTVKMSLISWQGTIVNEWSVAYARRNDALDHAMDRADQEGHAGIMWATFSQGKTQEVAFDSHDPRGIEVFAKAALPYMTNKKLDVDRLLRESSVRMPGPNLKSAKCK